MQKLVIDDQEIVATRGSAMPGWRDPVGRAAAGGDHPGRVGRGPGHRPQPHAGTIEDVNFLGAVVRIRVRFKENAVSLDTFNSPTVAPPAIGQPVTVTFGREDVLVLEGAEAA